MGICSGAAIGVTFTSPSTAEQQLYFGHLDQYTTHPVSKTSLFDLASLTKPFATTLSCLALISQDTITLATTLPQLLPKIEVPADKRDITLAQLLSHRSGLPAHRPYYLKLTKLPRAKRQHALLAMLLAEPLQTAPDQLEVYSDLGFMLLGECIRQLSGKDLEQFSCETIFRPLGLEKKILFCPKENGKKEFVATEKCAWRQTLLCGEVHDQNCWAMGGVCGQAGLFATLPAVLHLVRLLLQIKTRQASHPAIATPLLQQAMTSQHGPQSWGLGFDTPDLTNSAAGRFISAESCGHLGFSGTSFWLDFSKEVGVVLLTNRIHPNADNNKIRAFRPRLHDAVFSSFRGDEKN